MRCGNERAGFRCAGNGLARVQAGSLAPRPSSIGTRVFGGRIADVQALAAATTYETLIAIATAAEAIRLVYAVGYDATSTAPLFFSGAAAVSDASQATVNAAPATVVSHSEAGQTTLAAQSAGAGRRCVFCSDWMAIPSVPRTDGFPGALYALRTYVAAGTVVMLGNGA